MATMLAFKRPLQRRVILLSRQGSLQLISQSMFSSSSPAVPVNSAASSLLSQATLQAAESRTQRFTEDVCNSFHDVTATSYQAASTIGAGKEKDPGQESREKVWGCIILSILSILSYSIAFFMLCVLVGMIDISGYGALEIIP